MVKYLKKYLIFFISYDEYIKLYPDDSWGWKYKGNLLKELKRYDEAL